MSQSVRSRSSSSHPKPLAGESEYVSVISRCDPSNYIEEDPLEDMETSEKVSSVNAPSHESMTSPVSVLPQPPLYRLCIGLIERKIVPIPKRVTMGTEGTSRAWKGGAGPSVVGQSRPP